MSRYVTPTDISYYIDSHHLAYIFISEILDITHTSVFITLKPDFYIRMYYSFMGNYTGFTVMGLVCS